MKIDFYIIENGGEAEAWLAACEQTAAAATTGKVYLYTANEAASDQMDDLLWSYQPDAFIPHQCLDVNDPEPPAVQIGNMPPPSDYTGTLINLQPTLPAFYTQFDRLVEIVFSDPTVQQLARERYKHYRDAGHELNTHKQ